MPFVFHHGNGLVMPMTTAVPPLSALRFAFALGADLPGRFSASSLVSPNTAPTAARKTRCSFSVRFGWLVLLAILQFCLLAQAMAVDVAQVRVLSHIGQPLQAEVELTGVASGEVLQVKQAWPDTYRLANIQRNPVLNNLRVQLQAQGNGAGQRYSVSLQTGQAVLDPYLNIFLEIADRKEQHVRALTIWLEPDPQQPIAESLLHEASEQRKRLSAHPDGELALDLPALAAANRAQPAPSPTPSKVEVAENTTSSATPTSKPPVQASAPAGCNAAAVRKQAERCQLVAEANIRLDGQLEELEQKVDILKRVVLADKPVEAVAAQAATPSPVSLAPQPPINIKKKPPKSSFPWMILMISAGVFVGVAVVVFGGLMLRSKLKAKRKPAGAPAVPPDQNAATPAEPSTDASSVAVATPITAAGSGKRARVAAWFAAKRAAMRRSLHNAGSKLAWPGRRFKAWINALRSKRQAKQAASNAPSESGDAAQGSS